MAAEQYEGSGRREVIAGLLDSLRVKSPQHAATVLALLDLADAIRGTGQQQGALLEAPLPGLRVHPMMAPPAHVIDSATGREHEGTSEGCPGCFWEPPFPPIAVDARAQGPGLADADGTYEMRGYCTNCQYDPVVGMFGRGHSVASGVMGPPCPRCGVTSLMWRGPA